MEAFVRSEYQRKMLWHGNEIKKNRTAQESLSDAFEIQPHCLFGLVSSKQKCTCQMIFICKESYLLAYSWWTLAFELSGPLHTSYQLYTTVTQSKAPLQIHVDFFALCKCGGVVFILFLCQKLDFLKYIFLKQN